MFILAPSFFLLGTAAIIQILHIFRPRFNATWLIAVTGTFISWMSLLFLRFRLPTNLVYLHWNIGKLYIDSPALIIDYSTWPYAFAISTLILAIVLSSPANLQSRMEISSLAGNLAITGLSYFAFLASNLVSLLIGWAAIDLIEISALLRNNPESKNNQRIIIGFTSRFLGLILIFWAIVLGSRESGFRTDFTNLSPLVGLPVLIGIGLRLGLFPVHLTYSEETSIRRSQGNLFRFIPPAASLVLLSRIPPETLSPDMNLIIRVLSMIAAVYGLIRWLSGKRELDTRPYWVMILSSLAILSTLNGFSMTSVSWGVSMILLGGALYLHDFKTRFIQVLLFIGLVLFTGIPYTPNASGLAGLMGSPNLFIEIISLLIFLPLLIGYFRKINDKAFMPTGFERIVYLTYPLSILLLIISFVVIGLFGWRGSRIVGAWPAIITGFVIIILTMIGNKFLPRQITYVMNSLADFINKYSLIRQYARKIFKFSWVYTLFRWIFGIIGRIINWFTFLLEGESGLLWGMVFLILLIMVIGGRG
jgi:hypothetical protein